MTVKQLRDEADKIGYAVRKKGSKREYVNSEYPDGSPVLDFYHPHIRMRASEYARTKKVYRLFAEQIKKHFGREMKTDSEVYRHYLLLMIEHCARELKITGDGVKVVTKMMLPLPKEEWLKPIRKAKTDTKGEGEKKVMVYDTFPLTRRH